MSGRSLRNRPGDRGHASRGAVLVAALLALTLLASAVFFVFNVGTHMHRRIEAQHAADAAAIAGAGWVARSLNLVAINNVETARLLAQAQVIDALPLALRNSVDDTQAALTGIENQQRRGLPGHPWLDPALEEVRLDLQRQRAIFQGVADAIARNAPGAYDVSQMTWYETPTGDRGSFWQAMASLENISVATLEQLGVTAQIAAHTAARDNFTQAGGRGFLVPFVPEFPWVRGEPKDFVDPITLGRLPADYDDAVWARGPFDALFGLRRLQTNGSTPVASDFVVDLGNDYPIPEARPERDLPSGDVRGYRVMPIYTFFERQLGDMESTAFDGDFTRDGRSTWFAERAADTARQNQASLVAKLNGGAGQPSETTMAHWSDEWSLREAIAATPGATLSQMWVFLEFEPELVDADGNPLDGDLTLSSWSLYPFVPVGLKGGGGPDRTPDMDRVGADGRVRRMQRVGTFPGSGDPDQQWVQTTYAVWCAVNAYRNTGTFERRARDPNNFTSVDDLPAPVHLDLTRLPHDNNAARRQFLRFFAAADQPAEAPIWAGLFEGNDAEPAGRNVNPDDPDPDADAPQRPWRRAVAIASAEVFNNHSWDLWTQMWHAQLIPVGNLRGDADSDAWLPLMKRTGFITESLQALDAIDDDFNRNVARTALYLERVAPLIEAVDQPRRPQSPIYGSAP